MQLASIKALIAMLWVSAVTIAGIAGNLNSSSSWIVLAGVAVLPALVMMRRWNPTGRAAAMPPSIFAANGAPTRRINRRPIRTRGCTGKRTAVRRNWPSLVEQAFGWMKTVGGMRKLRHRGGPLVAWMFTFSAAAYNIVRLRRLLPATT